MAAIKSPDTFAKCFGVDPANLRLLGVLNPTLAADVRLFVDPLLLSRSSVPEMRNDADLAFRKHFRELVKLLAVSKREGDAAWRSAQRRFQFHEIPGTCLGYGAGTIFGSGFGSASSTKVLRTAREIVALGIEDPTLFPLLGLLEEGVGPDMIGDMVTNVALPAFFALTARVCNELGIPTDSFSVGDCTGPLPRNPLQDRRTPVILVADDVLRPLPIAHSWGDVAAAADSNAALRCRVTDRIGHLFAAQSKRQKRELRSQALASKQAFVALLDAVHAVPPIAYSTRSDPEGLIKWAESSSEYATKYPIALERPDSPDDAFRLVGTIIEQFKRLVEKNGLAYLLWNGNTPKHEKAAQRLFFGVAHSYCRANNLDVSPEADAGRGPVDFKFSSGFACRVLVEIKLSKNTKLVDGYAKQLPTYGEAEETLLGYYLVIDVGQMGTKDERITNLRNDALSSGGSPPTILFVDGTIKPSASHQ